MTVDCYERYESWQRFVYVIGETGPICYCGSGHWVDEENPALAQVGLRTVSHEMLVKATLAIHKGALCLGQTQI